MKLTLEINTGWTELNKCNLIKIGKKLFLTDGKKKILTDDEKGHKSFKLVVENWKKGKTKQEHKIGIAPIEYKAIIELLEKVRSEEVGLTSLKEYTSELKPEDVGLVATYRRKKQKSDRKRRKK